MYRAFLFISVSLRVEKGMDSGSNTHWLGSTSPVLLGPRPRHVLALNEKFSQYLNDNSSLF